MKLENYKLIFIVVGLVGVLLLASPALMTAVRLPEGEKFSELYLLGPGRKAENYPYNIAVGQNYLVYLGVGNHEGSVAYYVVYVKLLSMTGSLPNDASHAPSPVAPLYEFRLSLANNVTWERPFTFSVDRALEGNQTAINRLTVNGVGLDVGDSAVYNSSSPTYRLVFELWMHNRSLGSIQFHDRFVYLELNLT